MCKNPNEREKIFVEKCTSENTFNFWHSDGKSVNFLTHVKEIEF